MGEDWRPQPGDILIIVVQVYLVYADWLLQHGAGLWW
jgi:hypothetical protein